MLIQICIDCQQMLDFLSIKIPIKRLLSLLAVARCWAKLSLSTFYTKLRPKFHTTFLRIYTKNSKVNQKRIKKLLPRPSSHTYLALCWDFDKYIYMWSGSWYQSPMSYPQPLALGHHTQCTKQKIIIFS